jgi:hypothetical protein
MHRALGQEAGDGLHIRRFDLDPGQELFAQAFGGPGGQDGPVDFPLGVGQGGGHRMEAIKPVFRAFLAMVGSPLPPVRAIPGRLGTAFPVDILSTHGGPYREAASPGKPAGRERLISAIFQNNRPLTPSPD